MAIYEFEDYKKYINTWIEGQPKKGRGEFKKISEAIGVHSTMVSHIFKAEKQLTMDQAFLLTEYLGFSQLETDYFLTLVRFERSGHFKYKEKIKEELIEIKNKASEVKNRLPTSDVLSDEDKAEFYSSWHYSAIRTLASLEEYSNRKEIIEKVGLPFDKGNKIVEFLIAKGLCIEENSTLKSGPARTHIGPDSPHLWRHHTNWRLKNMDRHKKLTKEEFMITAPLSISKKDMFLVKEKLMYFLEELGSTVEQTTPEQVSCLTIDWVYLD